MVGEVEKREGKSRGCKHATRASERLKLRAPRGVESGEREERDGCSGCGGGGVYLPVARGLRACQ